MFQRLGSGLRCCRLFLPAIPIALALTVCSTLGHAMELPSGKLPLLNTPALSADKLNTLAGGEGAVALSRLTIHYKFGVLLGEPVMAFRGNYDLREPAIVEVSEKCWGHVSRHGLEGVSAAASPYVRVENTERFRAAFAEAELLSDSTFSIQVVPNQKVILDNRNVDVAGMHLRFRPDTLKRSLDLGMVVNASPSWDGFLQRKDGSFYSEAEAKEVFRVGFDVEGLSLVDLDYNVNALASAAEAYCREALAVVAKAAEPPAQDAPMDSISALESKLESAFGNEGGVPAVRRQNDTSQQPTSGAGDGILEDAFALAEDSRAKRLKIEALKNTSDQFLGVAETPSRFLRVLAQDHGSEDGDKVTILLNGSEVLTFTLANATRQIDIPLQKGENVIEIMALNQGSSGKNTALFWVETEDGRELVRREWNLTSGGNAKLLVIRV